MALKGSRGRNATPERVLSSVPATSPTGRAILEEQVEYDAYLCDLCGKTAALHKVVNRHTSSRAPILECEVGGHKRPIPGFVLGPYRYTRSVDVCPGCSQAIRGGGLYAKTKAGEYVSVHNSADCRAKAGVE